MSKDWIIQPTWDGSTDAGRDWGVPPIIARLLYNRQVANPDEAKAFLSPHLAHLHPPELLPGAARAAERIADAVRARHRIVLYGDYDVDGITGVAILWHVLQLADADVAFYVPHRIEEGYGLNSEALRSLAGEGAKMIVSVDCGVTAVEEARVARELGVSLIVTDHHQPRAELPNADVIVHPQVGGEYPNPHICGAGVAFKLAWEIARKMCGSEKVTSEYRQFLMDALPLAALGTVADVVPLVGENRVLTRCGLARIRECPLPGVRALLDVAGVLDGKVSDSDVGFKLAPRINAAGRMGHARLAIELLTRADENRAREIALYLDEHNRSRQSLERKVAKQAREMIEQAGLDGDANRGIVLAGENWHPGVVGIVASRMVDRFHKPTVIIALDNGLGQGSARSVASFELHKALEACGQHLISFGGHAMAAGLKIEADNVDAFTEAFVRYANNTLNGSALRPKLRIDAEVLLRELDDRTVTAIQNLGPFGMGNARPLLATDWLELADEPRCVGRNGDHLQVALREDGATLKGIAFGAVDHLEQLKEHRRCRVAFEPIISEFNGRRRVELQVVDFKYPCD